MSRRNGIRPGFAPAAPLLTFITWLVLLTLGFGLMTHAVRNSFHPPLENFSQAFFVAGSRLVTLGAKLLYDETKKATRELTQQLTLDPTTSVTSPDAARDAMKRLANAAMRYCPNTSVFCRRRDEYLARIEAISLYLGTCALDISSKEKRRTPPLRLRAYGFHVIVALQPEGKGMARINLIAWDNGVGLSTDLRLLGERLRQHRHHVSLSTIRRGKLRKIFRPIALRARIAALRVLGSRVRQFDINIFLEHVRPEFLPLARSNVLIPNPEWFDMHDERLTATLHGVLAKTRHSEAIFRPRLPATRFIGFTSRDRRDVDVARRRAFFHLAGRSENKNTEPLLALWRRHPEWPTLTVVQNPRTAKPAAPAPNIDHRVDYLDDAELRRLQNEHAFHLCPSQTEGFGHYLMEALGIGAVTVTLDAAPMNELVARDHGLLVAARPIGTQNLSTIYTFDDADMERAIAECIAMPDARIAEFSRAARAFFDSNDHRFTEQLGSAIAAIAA